MKVALDLFARYLERPVLAARPFLVLKFTLILFGFDLLLTRSQHGGRYGAGGFNVAHFAALDAVQPPVSPALFVGLVTLCGLLCILLALLHRPPRWAQVLLFVGCTWAWAMSMLDSYQHHYLLSLVALALVFFPRASSAEVLPAASDGAGAAAPTTSAFAYPALALNIAVVYAYTAYAKTADDWLSGATLRTVTSTERLEPLAAAFVAVTGLDRAHFFWSAGHSVVLVQMVCAAGYVLAPLRDALPRKTWATRLVRAFLWIALSTALSFHLGAEWLSLKIGWFSAYMCVYALIYMLPEPAVLFLVRLFGSSSPDARTSWIRFALGLVGLAVGVSAQLFFVSAAAGTVLVSAAIAVWRIRGPLAEPMVLTLGVVALVVAGAMVDLPGAAWAGRLLALGVSLAVLVDSRRAGVRVHFGACGTAALVAAAALMFAVYQSEVRFDYYRLVGGDHRRRGELEAALAAYEKANRYAPPPEVAVAQGRVRIPDDGRSAAALAVRTTSSGRVQGLRVEAWIEHPRPSDLTVELEHRWGSGPRRRRRRRLEGLEIGPGGVRVDRPVAGFARTKAEGSWTLRVRNTAAGEAGYLRRFGVSIRRDRRAAAARVRARLRRRDER